MAREKLTERGENLVECRKKLFAKRSDAVEAFVAQGCSITYERYSDLERGSMPNDLELRQICIMLKADANTWLISHDPDFEMHCDTFAGLSPAMRQMALNVVGAIRKTGDELGI